MEHPTSLLKDAEIVERGLKVMSGVVTADQQPVEDVALAQQEASKLRGSSSQSQRNNHNNFSGGGGTIDDGTHSSIATVTIGSSNSNTEAAVLSTALLTATKGWELQRQFNALREQSVESPQGILEKMRGQVSVIHNFTTQAEQCVKRQITTLYGSGKLQAAFANIQPHFSGIDEVYEGEDVIEDFVDQGLIWCEEGIRYYILNHPAILHSWMSQVNGFQKENTARMHMLTEARLAKSVHAEVKSRNALLCLPQLDTVVQVPLCASFEYLGALVFAEVDLGLSKNTLVHGSYSTVCSQFGGMPPNGHGAGGCQLHRGCDFASRALCLSNNLRSQSIGITTVHVNAALQGHLGIDGVLYMRNLHRLRTPMLGSELNGLGLEAAPLLSGDVHSVNETPARRMRPEFIRRYHTTASFKGDCWLRNRTAAPDPQDIEVLTASGAMHKKAIPDLVDLLMIIDVLLVHGELLGAKEEAKATDDQRMSPDLERVGSAGCSSTDEADAAIEAAEKILRKRRKSGMGSKKVSIMRRKSKVLQSTNSDMGGQFDSLDDVTMLVSNPTSQAPSRHTSMRNVKQGGRLGVTAPSNLLSRSDDGSSETLAQQKKRKMSQNTPLGVRYLWASGMSSPATVIDDAKRKLRRFRYQFNVNNVSAIAHSFGVNLCYLGVVLSVLETRLEVHDQVLANGPAAAEGVFQPHGMSSSKAASPSAAATSSPINLENAMGRRKYPLDANTETVSSAEFILKHPVVAALRQEMIARASRHVLNKRWRQVAADTLSSERHASTPSKKHRQTTHGQLSDHVFCEATIDFLMKISGDGLSFMSNGDKDLYEKEIFPCIAAIFDYHHMHFFRTPGLETSVPLKGVGNEEPVIVGTTQIRRTRKDRTSGDGKPDVFSIEPRPIKIAGVESTSWGTIKDETYTVGYRGAATFTSMREGSPTNTGGGSPTKLGSSSATVEEGGAEDHNRMSKSETFNPLSPYTVSNKHANGVPPSVVHDTSADQVRFCAQQDGNLVARICELSNVNLTRRTGLSITGYWVDVNPRKAKLEVKSPFTPEQMQNLATGNFSAVEQELQNRIREQRRVWNRQGSQAADLHCQSLYFVNTLFMTACGRYHNALELLQKQRQAIITDMCHSDLGLVSLQLQQSKLEVARKRYTEAIEVATSALQIAEDHLQRTKLVPTAMMALLDAIDVSDNNTMAMKQKKQDLISRLIPTCRQLLLPVGRVLARDAIVGKLLFDHGLSSGLTAQSAASGSFGTRASFSMQRTSSNLTGSVSLARYNSGSNLTTSMTTNVPPIDPMLVGEVFTAKLRDSFQMAIKEQGCRVPEVIYFATRYCVFRNTITMLPTVTKAIAMHVPLTSPYLRQCMLALIEYASSRLRGAAATGNAGGIGLQLADLARVQWVDVVDPLLGFQNIRDACSDELNPQPAKAGNDFKRASALWAEDHAPPLAAAKDERYAFSDDFDLLSPFEVNKLMSSFIPTDYFLEISTRQQHWVIYNSLNYIVKYWMGSLLNMLPHSLQQAPHRWDLATMMSFAEIVDSVHSISICDPSIGVSLNAILISKLKTIGTEANSTAPSPLMIPFHLELALVYSIVVENDSDAFRALLGSTGTKVVDECRGVRRGGGDDGGSPLSPSSQSPRCRHQREPMTFGPHNWKDAIRPMQSFINAVRSMKALVECIRHEIDNPPMKLSTKDSFLSGSVLDSAMLAQSHSTSGGQQTTRVTAEQLFPSSFDSQPAENENDDPLENTSASLKGLNSTASFSSKSKTPQKPTTPATTDNGDKHVHVSGSTASLITYGFSVELAKAKPPAKPVAKEDEEEDKEENNNSSPFSEYKKQREDPDEALCQVERSILDHIRSFKDALGPWTISAIEATTSEHRVLRCPMWESFLECYTELYDLEVYLFTPLLDADSSFRTKSQAVELISTLKSITTLGAQHLGAITGQARYEELLRVQEQLLADIESEERLMDGEIREYEHRLMVIQQQQQLQQLQKQQQLRNESGSNSEVMSRQRSPGSTPQAFITPQQRSLGLPHPTSAEGASPTGRNRFMSISPSKGKSMDHNSRATLSGSTDGSSPQPKKKPANAISSTGVDKTPLHVKQESKRPKPVLDITPSHVVLGQPVQVTWIFPKIIPSAQAWIGVFSKEAHGGQSWEKLRRSDALLVKQGLRYRQQMGEDLEFKLPHAMGVYLIAFFQEAAGAPFSAAFVKEVHVVEYVAKPTQQHGKGSRTGGKHGKGSGKADIAMKRSESLLPAIGRKKNNPTPQSTEAVVVVPVKDKTWIPFDTKRAQHERVMGLKQRDQVERNWEATVQREHSLQTVGRSKTALDFIDRSISPLRSRAESPPRKCVTPVLGSATSGNSPPPVKPLGASKTPSFVGGSSGGTSTTLHKNVTVKYSLSTKDEFEIEAQRKRYKRAVSNVVSKNQGVESVVVIGNGEEEGGIGANGTKRRKWRRTSVLE